MCTHILTKDSNPCECVLHHASSFSLTRLRGESEAVLGNDGEDRAGADPQLQTRASISLVSAVALSLVSLISGGIPQCGFKEQDTRGQTNYRTADLDIHVICAPAVSKPCLCNLVLKGGCQNVDEQAWSGLGHVVLLFWMAGALVFYDHFWILLR